MAIKDLTSTLLKRLEEGTAQIYSKYQTLIQSSGQSFDRKIKELDTDYDNAANQASARAKIDLKNTLEKMADSGYVRSGETVHATIASNASRAGALSDLAVQKAKDKNALVSQKEEVEAKYSSAAQSEANQFQTKMMEAIRDQENQDRSYQAKQEEFAWEKEQTEKENALAQEKLAFEKEQAQKASALDQERFLWEKEQAERAALLQQEAIAREKEQQAFENKIASEKLELERIKAAAQAAADSAEKKENQGITPDKSPYEYVKEIVKENTRYYPKKGYSVEDRKAILQTISAIIQDTHLSLQYRYEMYLYGKSLGYIED